jgi:hypothetical protein
MEQEFDFSHVNAKLAEEVSKAAETFTRPRLVLFNAGDNMLELPCDEKTLCSIPRLVAGIDRKEETHVDTEF